MLDALTHKPYPARRAAVADLSSERVARRILDVYQSVLGKGSAAVEARCVAAPMTSG